MVIPGSVRNYFEPYVKKFENICEMDKFWEKYNLPKLNQEVESLNGTITAGEIKAIIKTLLAHKTPGMDSFIEEFHKTLKKELTPILTRLFQKHPRRRLQNYFYEASMILIQKPYRYTAKKKQTIGRYSWCI